MSRLLAIIGTSVVFLFAGQAFASASEEVTSAPVVEEGTATDKAAAPVETAVPDEATATGDKVKVEEGSTGSEVAK